MGRLKELLTTDAESELIPSTIYGVLIESVKDVLVGTQIVRRIGPESIPGSSIDIDLNTKNSMIVEKTAETAEFSKSQAAAENFNLKPIKRTIDIQISREMIEDSKFDVIEWQIQEAGYQMARNMDLDILQEIKDGADANTTTHDTNAGAAITVAYITATMKFLEADGYHPSHLLVNSGAAEDLRNIDTFVEADKLGSREAFERGLIGRIFGMNVIQTEQAQLNQSTYDYALMVDSRHALVLAEKRPISIARYDQANKDITGIAVSARYEPRYLRADACAYAYCTV
jgi:HK97 family phage major capsid protein